jgi:hypothetical protein
MKIRYLLKKKAKKAYLIYVALYDNDDTEIISTGERCLLKDWSKEERIPKNHDSDLFQNLEKVKNGVLKVKRVMEANDLPTSPFTLKTAYLKTLKMKDDKQHQQDKHDKVNLTSISSLIGKWIKEGLDNYQPSTKKVVITSIKMFQDYLKVSGQPKLERKELSLDIISEYARHLQVKKKLKDSTHGKKMKHLRWFLKYIKFDSSQINEIKIRSVKPSERNIIHLTSSELEALEFVDVSYDKELQRSKDAFLIGCYSGLRMSDIKRISKHRIENNCINLTLKKNRVSVSIPLLTQLEKILQRYEYSAPKISEQQLNDSIKIVCQKAGINKKIFFKSKKAGQLIETLHPKHELITSHCAGKTFISLAGEKWGLTPTDVAAIVGKDVKTILGYYLKPDQETAKKKMIESANRAQMVKVS